jgi:hypothetical protein
VTRPHRALATVLLALLLLAMQHEGQRHAISHWTPAPNRGQQHSLHAEAASPCAECALLAAAANGLASSPTALPVVAVALLSGAYAPVSALVAAPSPYRSRAPPTLL